jgi:hypothetical protein
LSRISFTLIVRWRNVSCSSWRVSASVDARATIGPADEIQERRRSFVDRHRSDSPTAPRS